jgi:uncharacterized membrane protein YhaH (DUF805 family)
MKNSVIWRTIALVMILIGSVGSIGYTLREGANNRSILLVALFVTWVFSPFIALLVANIASKRWTDSARVVFFVLVIILTFGALASYSGILALPGAKPAFRFLVTPLISWLLIIIVIFISRRGNRV